VRASLAGKAVETAMQVLLVTLVPRLLGPADYGGFALALTLVTIGSASVSFSGPTVMARFVPAAPPSERTALARALLLRIGRWRLAQVVLFAALPAAVLVAVDPGRFPPLEAGLIVLAFALDVGATLVFQVALGLGRALFWSFRFPVQYAVLVTAAPALDALGGAPGAVVAIALASGAALVVGAAVVLPPVLRARAGAPLPPGALRFGVLHGASGVFSLIASRGGVVAVALLTASSVETGYAALATGIAIAGTQVVVQAFAVQLPGLVLADTAMTTGSSTEAARSRRSAGEGPARLLAERAELALLPLAIVAAAVVKPALPVAIGERFEGAADAFAPALAALPLAPVTALALQTAALRLRPEARLWATVAGALAFAITAVVAIPPWEAAGGSTALLAGTLATNVASLGFFPDVLRGWLLPVSIGGAGLVLAVGLAV
jgi:hypothetical protein